MEYRTVNSVSFSQPSRSLIATIHEMEMVQDWTREYMIAEGITPPACVGAFKSHDDAAVCAAKVREILGLSENWFEKHPNAAASYRFMRNAISNAGVLVMMNGVVGNNTHKPLDIAEFRAFAMVDAYAPLIFINTNDSESGKLFSLIHEFAHVCVGESDFFNDRSSGAETVRPVEVLCNAVTAEILVPQNLFLAKWNEYIQNYDKEIAIRVLSGFFRCGTTVIARRALDNRKISREVYRKIAKAAIEQYNKEKQRNKEKGSGGDFYRTKLSKMDKRFFAMLTNSVLEGRTQYTDAFRLTSTNRATYEKLVGAQKGGV
jgi:Zn-dependent peptidase ImmA (M78 family)